MDYLQQALAKTGFCCSDICCLSGSFLTCSFTFTPSMFRTLFCKGEAKKNHKWQRLNFRKKKKICGTASGVGPVTLWSDTYLNSLFLPSLRLPPSINIACLHLSLAPFDEAPLLPSGGLTRSALPRLSPSLHLRQTLLWSRLRSVPSHSGGAKLKCTVPTQGMSASWWTGVEGVKKKKRGLSS